MKLFYLCVICSLVFQTNAFWFRDLLKSSYNDCLSSYSFMVNYKKHCDDGKSFIESEFDDDVDDEIFRSVPNLREHKKNKRKEEEKDCYTAQLLFELGKSKDRLIKRAGCNSTDMVFRSNTTRIESKLFLTYTLECNKTITRVNKKGKTIQKYKLIQELKRMRCEKAKLLENQDKTIRVWRMNNTKRGNDQYFKKMSESSDEWEEVLNNKTIYRFVKIKQNSTKNTVLKSTDRKNFYIELSDDNAKFGISPDNITNVFKHGSWVDLKKLPCKVVKNCKMDPKNKQCQPDECVDCNIDRDCAKNERCSNFVCLENRNSCKTRKDCSKGETCRRGECMQKGACKTHEDCGHKGKCANNTCVRKHKKNQF